MSKKISRRELFHASMMCGGLMGTNNLIFFGNKSPSQSRALEEILDVDSKNGKKIEADVVIVGGGMSGVCAALAAARCGASTILIQDRPVLGGNSSSEVRMHICGAEGGGHKHARESGILEELRLENQMRNPQRSAAMWDLILWEKVYYQPKLTLLLNTIMLKCQKENDLIRSIFCYQFRTENHYQIEGQVFIDCTGDGFLGVLAGNPYKVGQEAIREFNESLAPDNATPYVLGSSILFQGRDMGRPTSFIKPSWAYSFPTDNDIVRDHSELEYGYWWIEWGGTLDIIKDDDKIKEELLKILFGVWDHIKNQEDHKADNWVLDWFGFIPARRESRRLMGAYILTQEDLVSGRVFPDEVAYGGWAIDHHYPKGFHHKDKKFWESHKLKKIYSIPLRSLYSTNIKNLFLGGRAISATHIAFCSTRVMGTCSVMGQAAGTAAAYCCSKGLLPDQLSENDIGTIKQILLKHDAFLIGTSNHDPEDYALKSAVSAGSFQNGSEARKVNDGVTRQIGEETHQWRSKSLATNDTWLELDFNKKMKLSELHITFDTGFDRHMTLTHEDSYNNTMIPGPQPETVKDYRIEALMDDTWNIIKDVKGNYQIQNIHSFKDLSCQKIRIAVSSTNGIQEARIFEVRCYS